MAAAVVFFRGAANLVRVVTSVRGAQVARVGGSSTDPAGGSPLSPEFYERHGPFPVLGLPPSEYTEENAMLWKFLDQQLSSDSLLAMLSGATAKRSHEKDIPPKACLK